MFTLASEAEVCMGWGRGGGVRIENAAALDTKLSV